MRKRTSYGDWAARVDGGRLGSGLICGAAVAQAVRAASWSAIVADGSKCTTSSRRLRLGLLQPAAPRTHAAAARPAATRRLRPRLMAARVRGLRGDTATAR